MSASGTSPPAELRDAAVLVPVFRDADGELRVAIVVRADDGGLHGGQLGLPGGKPEPADADLLATALREAEEEVGLAPDDVDVIATLPPFEPPGSAEETPGALLLFEADATEAEMAEAGAVIAFAQFRSEALDEEADVVFPAQVYAEKEGTVTHPDGRLQRVRQALGHAGDSRPGWQVLADLCERVDASTGALSSSAVTALIAGAVPFYAGLTLDEIGGDGVRWQDREAASAAPDAELRSDRLEQPPLAPEGLTLASAPTLWTGPVVEHSASLRFLDTGPRVLVSPPDARELGLQRVSVTVESGKRGRDQVGLAHRQSVPKRRSKGTVLAHECARSDELESFAWSRTHHRCDHSLRAREAVLPRESSRAILSS